MKFRERISKLIACFRDKIRIVLRSKKEQNYILGIIERLDVTDETLDELKALLDSHREKL